MKQCCLALSVRGPQHLMELCGDILPRNLSVVELSAQDAVTAIVQTHFEELMHSNRQENYVICLYSSSFNDDYSKYAEIPTSEYLRDIIIFTDTHWKSLLCNSTQCCPEEGKEYSQQLTTCVLIRAWQEGLADWILQVPNSMDVLIESLTNLDVRDWVLSRAITSGETDWVTFLEYLTETHHNVALYTILAGFHYTKEDRDRALMYLGKARDVQSEYPLLQLLERGIMSSMPASVLTNSLQRFDETKHNIQCIKEASLLPKASPPTATRTGER